MKKNYDFSKGVRGKFAKKFALGTNLVAIDPDIIKAFPNSGSVNEALRHLLKIAKRVTNKVTSL